MRIPPLFITLCISAFSATASAARPIELEFGELVNHPQKYNGKRISVHAYVVTSCIHCGEFWASVKSVRDSRVHDKPVLQCIAIGGYRHGYVLPKWFAKKLDNQDYDGYVHVIGRFEYVHRTRHTDTLNGFGWYQIDDKQITDITELRPLGPPIPAHIN